MITKLLTAVVLLGAPATALASPRTLPSGAPACGNTMGKGGYNDGCSGEERAAWRAERARTEQHERDQRQAAQQREQQKALVAKVRTAVAATVLTVPVLARLRS